MKTASFDSVNRFEGQRASVYSTLRENTIKETWPSDSTDRNKVSLHPLASTPRLESPVQVSDGFAIHPMLIHDRLAIGISFAFVQQSLLS
jgi:hypothetical protein